MVSKLVASLQDDPGKSFSCDAEVGGATVVIAVTIVCAVAIV